MDTARPFPCVHDEWRDWVYPSTRKYLAIERKGPDSFPPGPLFLQSKPTADLHQRVGTLLIRRITRCKAGYRDRQCIPLARAPVSARQRVVFEPADLPDASIVLPIIDLVHAT